MLRISTDTDIQITSEGVNLPSMRTFDLDQTLDCGQCFRFQREEDGTWHGIAGAKPITLRPLSGGGILLEQVTEQDFYAFWLPYFDLERDYEAVIEGCNSHPRLSECARFASGVRVLRQDAFEALISFIISQNNNLPRIKGIVDRLCRLAGEPIDNSGERYAFPAPHTLAKLTENDLASLRAGWRSGYILDAAQKVASGEIVLEDIAHMPFEEAKRELQKIRGVGPKVADCALLYGMGRTEAFPMDVWMIRAMDTLFPGCKPQDFGEYAGIAQQYIFHYSRCHPQLFKN